MQDCICIFIRHSRLRDFSHYITQKFLCSKAQSLESSNKGYMLNLNKYTPLFMKRFLPILMRASYTRIHIDRNLYMWVFLKLRGQKSTLFGTSTKSSTFLRQTLLIKCRQPQNTSSKIYLSMYTFVKEYLQPF